LGDHARYTPELHPKGLVTASIVVARIFRQKMSEDAVSMQFKCSIFCIFALDFSNKDGSIAIPKES
jgi:hypothetical protein